MRTLKQALRNSTKVPKDCLQDFLSNSGAHLNPQATYQANFLTVKSVHKSTSYDFRLPVLFGQARESSSKVSALWATSPSDYPCNDQHFGL